MFPSEIICLMFTFSFQIFAYCLIWNICMIQTPHTCAIKCTHVERCTICGLTQSEQMKQNDNSLQVTGYIMLIYFALI